MSNVMELPFTIANNFISKPTQPKHTKLVDWTASLPFSIDKKCWSQPKPKERVALPFKIGPNTIPMVDSWIMKPADCLFKEVKGLIIAPISNYYGLQGNNNLIDFFNLKAKRCYQGDVVRKHLVHYINYFEKFYDTENYLYLYYCYMKYMVDYHPDYTKENLFDDIFKYIFNPVMLNKIKLMNEHNYNLKLGDEIKKSGVHPSLQYTNLHAKILMQISLMQKFTIPLVTHYISTHDGDTNEILMEFYKRIISMFTSVDIIAKLLETVSSSVKNSTKTHALWGMQNIRETNPTTHSIESAENIPLQLMPKYTYDRHIIAFNSSSIRRNIGYKVLDIGYGLNFIALSPSMRDEDNNSYVDKYEASLEKSDESKHMYIKANKASVLYSLTHCHGLGQFTQAEIDFFKRELSKDGKSIINPFQQELINNMVYQYFGDTKSPLMINKDEYITNMLVVRRMLQNHLTLLPYIISGKVVRLVDRKTVNKKEMEKLQASPSWAKVQDIYRNPDMDAKIMSKIAIILSSEFQYIDYNNPEVNGKKIEIIPEVICEEFLQYIIIMHLSQQ